MDFDYQLDVPAIEAYNRRKSLGSPYRLQLEPGPSPYDGNPFTASVVVLANNPGWDETVSSADHQLRIDGYPLPGLAPEAPEPLKAWTSRVLGQLADQFGPQRVSQKVAILQLVPWASKAFDSACKLPSREVQYAIAREAQARGAVMVVGRSFPIWTQALRSTKNLHYVINRRGMQISEGNLSPESWKAVTMAVGA